MPAFALAVLEVLNKSTYNITFDFRWTPSSAWTAAYTEGPWPGRDFLDELLDFAPGAPQALCNINVVGLADDSQPGAGIQPMVRHWHAAGLGGHTLRVPEYADRRRTLLRLFPSTPASSSASSMLPSWRSRTTAPTRSPSISRWTPSSAWTAYTEAPGQGEVLWTTYSTSLAPQALYNTSTSAGSQVTVNPRARIQPVVWDRHAARISGRTVRVPQYINRRRALLFR